LYGCDFSAFITCLDDFNAVESSKKFVEHLLNQILLCPKSNGYKSGEAKKNSIKSATKEGAKVTEALARSKFGKNIR